MRGTLFAAVGTQLSRRKSKFAFTTYVIAFFPPAQITPGYLRSPLGHFLRCAQISRRYLRRAQKTVDVTASANS